MSGSVSHSSVTEWISLQDPQNIEMQYWTELSPTRRGARRGGARSRDTRSLLRPKLAQPSARPRLRGGGDGTDPGRRTTPGSSSTAEVDTVSSIMTPAPSLWSCVLAVDCGGFVRCAPFLAGFCPTKLYLVIHPFRWSPLSHLSQHCGRAPSTRTVRLLGPGSGYNRVTVTRWRDT